MPIDVPTAMAIDGFRLEAPPSVAFGRFCVLPHRRELLADGRPAKLGGRAFDVLIALIEARGTVLGKDALMARVWPAAMARSKLSTKVVLLVSGIGLSLAAFAGSQPAAAQSYSNEYNWPAGFVYDPTYGCTLSGDAYEPYVYGYDAYYGGLRKFGHGFGHGMGGGGGITPQKIEQTCSPPAKVVQEQLGGGAYIGGRYSVRAVGCSRR